MISGVLRKRRKSNTWTKPARPLFCNGTIRVLRKEDLVCAPQTELWGRLKEPPTLGPVMKELVESTRSQRRFLYPCPRAMPPSQPPLPLCCAPPGTENIIKTETYNMYEMTK